MASRTKRKRYRQKQAKATAAGLQYAGGWGKGAPIQRADLLLVRRAIKERWPVPATTRDEIVARMFELFDEADTTNNARLSNSISRLVIEMEVANQRSLLEQLDALGAGWATKTPRNQLP